MLTIIIALVLELVYRHALGACPPLADESSSLSRGTSTQSVDK